MSRKPNRAVLGLLWGDEGKAKIIDILGKYAKMIVRYQGGANAGHTVMVQNKKTVLHQIPVGIMREDTQCVLGAGMVIDIERFFEELNELKKASIAYSGRLYISPRAHVVTPICKLIEEAMEKKSKIGTTMRGIGPTYAEKAYRTGVRMGDLLYDTELENKLKIRYDQCKTFFSSQGVIAPEFSKIFEQIMAKKEELKEMIVPVMPMVNKAMDDGIGVLFEGAQGSMLDIDWGTYPYVTSSNTTIGGMVTGAGVNPRKLDQVIGVTKAFTTRVGAGPFPTEVFDEQASVLRGTGDKPWDEFGSTTGRPRRIGWLDGVVLKHANTINGVDALALTKLDALDELEEIKICRAYWIDGEISENMPASIAQLENCRPIYDTVKGWKTSTRGITVYDELPEEAKVFVKHIEKLTGTPIIIVSTGPNREETVVVRHS